jgi:hypothetical protein
VVQANRFEVAGEPGACVHKQGHGVLSTKIDKLQRSLSQEKAKFNKFTYKVQVAYLVASQFIEKKWVKRKGGYGGRMMELKYPFHPLNHSGTALIDTHNRTGSTGMSSKSC